MSGRISLPRPQAEALLRAWKYLPSRMEKAWEIISAFGALEIALKPRAKKQIRKDRERQEKTKRSEKNAETSAIRVEVAKRADGRCEACGAGFNVIDPPALDHFWGRGKARQTVENCWLLHDRTCHRRKTDGEPSRKAWLEKFAAHCLKRGYRAEAAKAQRELESMALLAEAAELMLPKAGGR